MTDCHPVRRVRCPTCGVRRYNRCRNTAGEPITWHHIDRIFLADAPPIGAPRRDIPAELRAAAAEGMSVADLERTFGISRNTLYLHGLVAKRPAPERREVPEEALAWLAEGVSLREVARRVGVNRTVIRRARNQAYPAGDRS